jgi:hypothetical protein
MPGDVQTTASQIVIQLRVALRHYWANPKLPDYFAGNDLKTFHLLLFNESKEVCKQYSSIGLWLSG